MQKVEKQGWKNILKEIKIKLELGEGDVKSIYEST